MANRIPAPATGTLGNSPAPLNSNILPRWAYLALALACVAMGLWASYITLQYFEHGAKALETDAALQGLAVAAAVMFVASEMAALALAALLTERQLKARRWSLTGFAGAVLALEVCTIVAVQLALTVGADMTQASVTDTVADLQKQIATVEANAKTYAATAESLRAADQLKKAAVQTDKAAAETAKASQLYDRLEKARTQKRPTMTGLLGKEYAIAYAVARGVLVSLGGLVFFGVAGALLRAARGGTLSVDAQLVALLTELRDRPGALAAPVAPAQAVTLAAPVAPAAAPAQASYRPAGTVAPTAAPVGLSYGGKAMFGAGALAAMAAPVAHSAPAVPAVPAAGQPVNVDTPSPVNVHTPASANVGTSAALDAGVLTSSSPVNVDTPEPVIVDRPVPMQTGLFSPADGDVLTSPEPVNVDTPSPVNVDTAKAAKKTRKPRVVRDGSVMDSGLSEHDGARYRRALAGVKSGKFRPSLAGLAAGVEASAPVARRYLAAMADAGVIAPSGRGYALVKKGGMA